MPAAILKLLASVAIETPDAELIARFVSSRDEAAFAELVRRHGPIVHRVCRRLVGTTLADDAFQATFLVLACRVDRLRKPASVGSWLIGIAGRVARQMRRRDRRRAEVIRQLEKQESATERAPELAELAAILDDELTRLPDSLRDAVVLCLVEGRTQEEAVRRVGGSVRTLRRRLDRAKSLLRLRLERRGVVPAVAAGLVSVGMASARSVPDALVQKLVAGVSEFLTGHGTTIPAAIVAKGVIASMITTKHWMMAAGAGLVGLGLSLGAIAQSDSQPGLPPPNLPAAKLPTVPGFEPPGATDLPLARPARKTAGNLQYRTKNFVVVYAHSPAIARAVAAEAEYQRELIAKQWIGEALPAWERPAVIRVTHAETSSGGATAFSFGPKSVAGIEMNLNGPFLTVLESTLPHEVAHTVFATHFSKPLPRWADEGLAVLHESPQEQLNHDVRVRELLNAGRGIRLKTLLRMTEYPKDMLVPFAQGHSVVRFLLARGKELPKPGPGEHYAALMFLRIGMDGNSAESWDKAAQDVYAFKSVDELEREWLTWLKMPESRLIGNRPAEKPREEKPDLIPPTSLPGGAIPAGGR